MPTLPELPEVETVRRGLNTLTLNKTFEGGEVLLPRTLAYPLSHENFVPCLQGLAIAEWQRRGKYLLAQLADSKQEHQGYLGIHLRMTGQLLWTQQTETLQKHTRIRFFFPDNQELRFVDTRTFGKIWLVTDQPQVENVITGLKKLGPEPFSQEFSIPYFKNKLSKSSRNIKTFLLDQSVVAGIGNIYADEALFTSGIQPETLANRLDSDQIKSLHQGIISVLGTAIDQGGTTFSDFLNLLGVNGNYGNSALVYGRKGQPCRVCQTSIEKIKLGGRSTHFCPQCQPK